MHEVVSDAGLGRTREYNFPIRGWRCKGPEVGPGLVCRKNKEDEAGVQDGTAGTGQVTPVCGCRV